MVQLYSYLKVYDVQLQIYLLVMLFLKHFNYIEVQKPERHNSDV
jgi:hypothetical protein